MYLHVCKEHWSQCLVKVVFYALQFTGTSFIGFAVGGGGGGG